jgi:hypothetical protein
LSSCPSIIESTLTIAQYDKQMTVLKLRAARERKKARTGKCEGRKSLAEVAPEVLAELKRLRRKPKGGRPMSQSLRNLTRRV